MSNLALRKRFFLFLLLFLSALIPFSYAAGSREIRITAAVSPGFQKNPEWEKEIRDRVLFVNQIFEKTFGIHFSVYRFVTWQPQDEKRETDLLIEELRSQFSPGLDEIVVGFHKMSQPFAKDAVEDLDTIGTAQFFRGFVILRDPFNDLTTLQRQVTMAHEMAHLFGAIHVGGNNQIMNATLPAEPSMTFDADNQAIIQISSRVDFQTGITSLVGTEIDQLIQIYERLIRKNPHSDFYYELGSFYEARGLSARAVATWEEAVRYQYSNPLIHWQLGRYYYMNSRFDAAIQELGSAVAFFVLPSQKEERAMAFNFLGVAFYKKGNLEQATFNWLKGLSSDPDNLDLQGNLAGAYLESGNVDRAIAELLKLSAKYPNDSTTLSNLGAAYLQKKEYEKALAALKNSLDKMDYAREQKEIEEAKRLIQKKKPKKEAESTADKNRLMGDMPEAVIRLNLGAAYLGLGDLDPAAVELEAAKKMDPKSIETLQNLSYVYLKQKRYELAEETAKAGIELKRENPNFYPVLASAYAMMKKNKEALAAANAGLLYAPPPMRASLRKNIAVLYIQSGNIQQGLTELKNSLNDNWNDADTHVKLGYLYAQMNRPEDARRSLENALRIDPNQAEAKKALAGLFPKK